MKSVKKTIKKKPAPTVLVLRTVDQKGTAYNGFLWPKSGPVEAPDWSPTKECGRGLHGYLAGVGDAESIQWDGLWQVVEVVAADVIDLGDKVKFPRGNVLYTGDRLTATTMISDCYPGSPVIGVRRIGGDGATVTGGDGATVTGGDWATVTGGARATVTGGARAKVTGGDWATVTGGARATVTGGDGAKVTGGDGAKVTGGDGATLVLTWYDGKRSRIEVAYVGESGIQADKPYRLEAGKFVLKS